LHFGLGQAVSFFPGGRPALGVPVPLVLGQSCASGSLGANFLAAWLSKLFDFVVFSGFTV